MRGQGSWSGGSSGWSSGRSGGTVRERGRFTGKGPKGYQRSDERIREDISERMEQHPDLDASEIEVHVTRGEVTLKGEVSERQDKRMAEDIAEEVSGVKDVTNQIRVRKRSERNERDEDKDTEERSITPNRNASSAQQQTTQRSRTSGSSTSSS